MERQSPLKNAKSTTFDDLPPETVVDIFSRLPVKTLIRSTSVNKSWYSLIVNPKFISAQISRSISCCDENVVLIIPSYVSPRNPCSLISVETCSVIKQFDIPFNVKSETVKLSGSLNGLVLLTDLIPPRRCRELFLWNPSVRWYKSLVSSCFKEVAGDWMHSYCVVGLGFHEPSDDYRVVRIVYRGDDTGNQFGKLAPKVEVFSLRKNTWRKIKNPIVPRVAEEGGVFVNGKVYWLEAKPPNLEFEELCIISFDVKNEVFGLVILPNKVRCCLEGNSVFMIMEFEKSVSVCVSTVNASSVELRQPCYIWLMKTVDGVVSWTLRFRVVLKERCGWPLNITKSGTLIMESYNPDSTTLSSCNLNNMHYGDLGFCAPCAPLTVGTSMEDRLFMLGFSGPSIVDTSFIESLVMHGGGSALLRNAK